MTLTNLHPKEQKGVYYQIDYALNKVRDDIASVAYWYQTAPAAPFPPLPEVEELEIF